MREFHFEDPDEEHCPIEKDNFIDSQGKQKFERKTRSLFKPKFGNNGYICVAVAIAVLVAKCP